MNWTGLPAAFGLIFLAELGDKTQLAVVAQTCRFGDRPWPVFLGAGVALTAVTALGAIAGQLLGSVVPASIIRWVAAAAFLVMGLVFAAQAARRRREPSSSSCEDVCAEDSALQPAGGQFWAPFAATLGLLFLSELGDKTQLAVFSLSSQANDGLPVFVGGSLALLVVTAMGVLGGRALCRLLPQRALLWLSALAFLIIGLLMALGVL